MKITKEQQEKYLINPDKCPFCGHINIMAIEFDFAGSNEAHRTIECQNCPEVWREVFELSYIENNN